ncbi:rhomboid family intramembrane serine protease [Natronomonas sp. F2-12]|jgi:membrane associated rhomboid family serine protease|uniref:Rhomboid family intramembrane serine protease n=1 Tax=Natronomonas aquatica TaxID=2841590 RepID=A0A9R1CVB2_9EURY|nr:rhomboid family intramembrane serine protease [Natronomonas aquatica]MCQ4334407.1 rhomboid family intramembrane serine protease [Natronomonas aquatica]
MDPVTVGWYLLLGGGVAVSLAVLLWLARPDGRWKRRLRKRLYLGVPWGTLTVIALVATFYLFVQDGLSNPYDPIQIPFRAYSYFYPLGMLTSGFAHSGLGHVTGNLLSTLVFGSLAEYAWGHFPDDGGRGSPAVSRLGPPARIAAWAGALVGAGIVTSLFSLGPAIGFSGVVFACVGFTLVRYPIATIVAALSSGIVTQLYYALRTPEFRRTARETFSQPWWAGIAIQSHAVGLLVGVIGGLVLLYRRDVRPSPEHVWLAALAFAVDRGLWAIYLPVGSETYRLFRALGMSVVFLLAALVASGATATASEFVSRIELTGREAAFGLVVASTLALAFVAVPLNLYAVEDPNAGLGDAESVEIEDYTVFYAEDVENQFVPAVSLPGEVNGTGGGLESSGVIVVSERRNIWWEEVSERRLAAEGAATVRVGGLTWNENVRANRTTWEVAGGNETYNVRLGRAAADRPVVFRADPAETDAVIDGRNTTIAPDEDSFAVVVSRNNETLGTVEIPGDNETATAGGITVRREDRDLFAERNDTRIRIARRAE